MAGRAQRGARAQQPVDRPSSRRTSPPRDRRSRGRSAARRCTCGGSRNGVVDAVVLAGQGDHPGAGAVQAGGDDAAHSGRGKRDVRSSVSVSTMEHLGSRSSPATVVGADLRCAGSHRRHAAGCWSRCRTISRSVGCCHELSPRRRRGAHAVHDPVGHAGPRGRDGAGRRRVRDDARRRAARRRRLPAGRPGRRCLPIVLRVPYGRRTPDMGLDVVGEFFARKGYACVVQDVRGKFSSEGEFDPGAHEVDDGYDTVDWAAAQAWCDGRIGMWGESYYGATSWAAAISGHPAVRCIAPGDIGVDRRGVVVPAGRAAAQHHGLLGDGHGRAASTPTCRASTRTTCRSASIGRPRSGSRARFFARDREPPRGRARGGGGAACGTCCTAVTCPVLSWGGWYDNYIGAAAARLRRCVLSIHPRPETVHLLVGPWDHEGSAEHTDRAVCVQLPPHRRPSLGRLPGVLRPLPARRRQRLRARGQRRGVHDRAQRAGGASRPGRRPTCAPTAALPARRRPPLASRRRRPTRRPTPIAYDPADPVDETVGGQLLGALHGARRPPPAGRPRRTSSATCPSRWRRRWS